MTIRYVKGDLFDALPVYHGISLDRKILIPHICNDIGGWGSGFVVAVSKYCVGPENDYRNWFKGEPSSHAHISNKTFGLGETQLSHCKSAYIANMVAQHKTITKGESVPIRYSALVRCMMYVQYKMKQTDVLTAQEIWCPKFGSGLAKGKWDFIEALIKEIWVDSGIPVTVFEI